jgi:hypothetical protein
MRLQVFPEIAVAKNFIGTLFFPDERNNFHLDSWPTLAWDCGFDVDPDSLYEWATGKNAILCNLFKSSKRPNKSADDPLPSAVQQSQLPLSGEADMRSYRQVI